MEISEKQILMNYGFCCIYIQESRLIQFNVEILNQYVLSEH